MDIQIWDWTLKLLWERLVELNVHFGFRQILLNVELSFAILLQYYTPINKCSRIPFNLYELHPLKSSRLFEQITSQTPEFFPNFPAVQIHPWILKKD